MTDASDADTRFAQLFVTAQDGLRLYGRAYGPPDGALTPVVCLAGLTRNSADFHPLALRLSSGARPRRVLALDCRGRGESHYDEDWTNYDPRIEAQDALDFLTALEINEAIVIGTSRGGLVAFALAALRPSLIRAVILNDIGAVIEARGLARIRGYVGKLPPPRNLEEGAAILKTLSDGQFPALSEEQWLTQARAIWREADGALAPRYDLNLMRGLAALDLDKPLPPLWPYFMALKDVPTLVLRGANSDLLSAETAAEMTRRHPDCEAFTLPDQGHAPLLDDDPTLARIESFLARVDQKIRDATGAEASSSRAPA
ncbi:MAG: hypothetical protein BGP06_14330 [Rhizobiales bacterium 65-9]|nr:alpha/beta hydrolase [Hyphomicrobiales bacterium]OJY36847.1 MAG: hypothetical protein BGP06_14330 [Rhizobiales bacterium 65-9]